VAVEVDRDRPPLRGGVLDLGRPLDGASGEGVGEEDRGRVAGSGGDDPELTGRAADHRVEHRVPPAGASSAIDAAPRGTRRVGPVAATWQS
jgi:hypothetical protein